jgi:glutathione S-transferase
VPVERDQRSALVEATGSDTIPVLLLEDGTALIGEDAIEAYLEERYDEPAEAEAHRLKAAKAHRRYLEEECECSQPATR